MSRVDGSLVVGHRATAAGFCRLCRIHQECRKTASRESDTALTSETTLVQPRQSPPTEGALNRVCLVSRAESSGVPAPHGLTRSCPMFQR